MYFLHLPRSLPSAVDPSSISPSPPHFVFLSPATLFLLPLLLLLAAAVWLADTETIEHSVMVFGTRRTSLVSRGTTMAGTERGKGARRGGEASERERRTTSAHFRLCLNPITGGPESSFLGRESMSVSLCVSKRRISLRGARDANSLTSRLLKSIKCI